MHKPRPTSDAWLHFQCLYKPNIRTIINMSVSSYLLVCIFAYRQHMARSDAT